MDIFLALEIAVNFRPISSRIISFLSHDSVSIALNDALINLYTHGHMICTCN